VAADVLLRQEPDEEEDEEEDEGNRKKEDDDDEETEDGYSEAGTCLDFAKANGSRREPNRSYQYESGSPGAKISISRILSMSATVV
jgi:hypothetical protein